MINTNYKMLCKSNKDVKKIPHVNFNKKINMRNYKDEVF